ncbi:hypothetical protein HPB52_009096 [Rhipicephalus sanguineus]|uniref:Uncharacterized protein n=1 Tax=Rhipicephalus sanguineus TaxID=34632 RepID=A0A9D4SRW5_RHISA|nr:hypothetical protein HPB52_009096 [Rhipicephalus sanguineus]
MDSFKQKNQATLWLSQKRASTRTSGCASSSSTGRETTFLTRRRVCTRADACLRPFMETLASRILVCFDGASLRHSGSSELAFAHDKGGRLAELLRSFWATMNATAPARYACLREPTCDGLSNSSRRYSKRSMSCAHSSGRIIESFSAGYPSGLRAQDVGAVVLRIREASRTCVPGSPGPCVRAAINNAATTGLLAEISSP